MASDAFQDAISAENVCWGCGPANPHGLQIKSSWEGAESICRFRPDDCHIAAPGIVNGGILSSVIDCHCVCTAIAAYYKAERTAYRLRTEDFVRYGESRGHVPSPNTNRNRARNPGQNHRTNRNS